MTECTITWEIFPSEKKKNGNPLEDLSQCQCLKHVNIKKKKSWVSIVYKNVEKH